MERRSALGRAEILPTTNCATIAAIFVAGDAGIEGIIAIAFGSTEKLLAGGMGLLG